MGVLPVALILVAVDEGLVNQERVTYLLEGLVVSGLGLSVNSWCWWLRLRLWLLLHLHDLGLLVWLGHLLRRQVCNPVFGIDLDFHQLISTPPVFGRVLVVAIAVEPYGVAQ